MKGYFDQVEMNRGGRPLASKNVFVATDDPQVLAELKDKYSPEYTFLSNETVSRSASYEKRYNLEGLIGVIADIHILAQSDHLVCTMTSNICRIAYELQQDRQAFFLYNLKD